MYRTARLALACLLMLPVLGLGGCKTFGWGDDDEVAAARGGPEELHAAARRDLEARDFGGAVQRLELLEARFPFSESAKQGQIDLIYAYYKNREGESAIDQADEFIRENPTHPRVDYAYYIKGLVYFDAGANLLERAFNAELSKRPPQETRKSLQSFQILLQQYPNSPYAADARQRMIYLRNRLADYELEVARYYMKRGAYVGAANRARGLIESYDGAPAVLDALDIVTEAYLKLGLDDLAQVAETIRRDNTGPDDLARQPGAESGDPWWKFWN
jgi:outer membrane protein assembly factor BamD